MKRLQFHIILFTILINLPAILTAQNSVYKTGVIVDSLTNNPIPYVALYIKGTNKGVLSDENGMFKISSNTVHDTIITSVMGYRKKVFLYSNLHTSDNILKISPTTIKLNEVIITQDREKYSKKDNPAVALISKIIESKHLSNPCSSEYYNFEKYEKFNFALNEFSYNKDNEWLFEKYEFLNSHIDTSDVTNKSILNLSLKEKTSEIYYRLDPKSQIEIITGINRVGIDDITDQESLQVFIDNTFREIDIYDNDINILNNRFVSPLSHIATNFYKFYLTDTVSIKNDSCYEISFIPHNLQSLGFNGRIYIPLKDTIPYIKKATMTIPQSINLNFVNNLYIQQDYNITTNGKRIKNKDDLIIELSIYPGTQGIYARRNTVYSNHNFDEPKNQDIFSHKQNSIISADAFTHDDIFWTNKRTIPISKQEQNICKLAIQLRADPFYYWNEKILRTLISGYLHTSQKSKFDIGPINSFISHNDLEGWRIRIGGLTTANLNNRLFTRGYVAYGINDEKIKYGGELEYSFIDKKYHSREFPIHSLKISHHYDVNMLGQHYIFTNNDNILLSLTRQKNKQIIYERVSALEYTLELYNNLSLQTGIKHSRQESTLFMPFMNGAGVYLPYYDQTSFNLQLRYAPGEKFFQTKTERHLVNLDAPIIILAHSFSPMNFMGNMYTINSTEFSIQKRFWFSAFGHTDIILKAGHIWNQAPYPNLLIPNVNLSYTIQPESYALMNPMEFINDSYASWDITYSANGTIFNYIPLIQKMNLREVFTFKGLWGNLSGKNDPQYNDALFKFPDISQTKQMASKPYMEMGVGIENIFRFLRIDYVWRLSYKNYENIDKNGVRVAVNFKF